MKTERKILVFLILICTLALIQSPAYAQSEEAAEQRTLKAQERAEEVFEKPETVEEVMKMLMERAKLKIKEKRAELLKKTRVFASLITGYETNPLNDTGRKGDYFTEQDFFFNWQPTFNKTFGADVGYWLVNQPYFEQTDVSTFDNAVNFTLKYYPFEDGKLRLEPGIEHEWLYYPYDENSSYIDLKYFLKFKHYAGKKWNYGGKYEHSFKTYDKKRARDGDRQPLDLNREDNRDTVELYITTFFGKYSIKLKEKFYRNTSNDSYQEYYDYDSFKTYFTLSRTFLRGNKLYLSFTPSFERKNYQRRLAVDTARYDDVIEYKLNVIYSLDKNLNLSYTFTNKKVESNYPSGEYVDITHKVGISADF